MSRICAKWGQAHLARDIVLQKHQADIAGDRKLNKQELKALEDLAQVEAAYCKALSSIENLAAGHGDKDAMRWLALARTEGETSFMFATRAVTRPNTGLGRKQQR